MLRLAHSNASATQLFMKERLTMALLVGVATQIENGLSTASPSSTDAFPFEPTWAM